MLSKGEEGTVYKACLKKERNKEFAIKIVEKAMLKMSHLSSLEE